jgi:hypothetical protein
MATQVGIVSEGVKVVALAEEEDILGEGNISLGGGRGS